MEDAQEGGGDGRGETEFKKGSKKQKSCSECGRDGRGRFMVE